MNRLRRLVGPGGAGSSGSVLRVAAVVLVAGALAWSSFAAPEAAQTFGFDREQFRTEWNRLVTREGLDVFRIDSVEWTDEESGVFGFAFSPTMSIIGRVDPIPIGEVEELALVGRPAVDGRDVVLAGMNLVVAVTEPELTADDRAAVLSRLSVLGAAPADPDERIVAGDTRFRVAADPSTGVLGIGARPAAGAD